MSAPLPSSKTGLGLTSIVLLTLLVAGCIGGASDTDVEDPVENETNDSIKNQTNRSQIDFPDDVPFDPNSSLHPHDYWGDRKQIAIAERHEVEGFGQHYITEKCTSGRACPPRGAREIAIPIDPQSDQPTYVYPGTGKMEVSLDWEGENTFGVEPVLCVTNSGQPAIRSGCLSWHDENQPFNASHRFSTPGETWVIDSDELLSPPTWDVPHTLKSKWRFAVIAEHCLQDQRGPLSTHCIPADIDTFYFSATIFRGDEDLPLDPPHFDYYGDQESLVALPQTTLDADEHFMQGDCAVEEVAVLPLTAWYSENLRQQNPDTLCQFTAGRLFWEAYDGQEDQGRTPVIPPGTSVVEVQLSWQTGQGAPEEAGIHLGYRDAATNWDEGWTKPEGDCSGSSCTYEIGISKKQADSLYALQSVWEFGIFADTADQPAPPWNGISVDMSVTAHKEV